ncbi:hypothetical protein [Novosphingobium aureum]|uniref:hypothetical protein n=1 Tax=Novosphingobium aureum TaxID=2792964 RepID=UPI001E314176|nr:hypothetical protein [Novosphingobium aureum]
MASKLPTPVVEPLTAPQHYAPPTPRELRAQAIHRLQVGLFGLFAMLLIVGLANVIMDRARLVDDEDPIRDVVAADAPEKKQVSDPLADIGVVPAADPSPSPTPSPRALDGQTGIDGQRGDGAMREGQVPAGGARQGQVPGQRQQGQGVPDPLAPDALPPGARPAPRQAPGN